MTHMNTMECWVVAKKNMDVLYMDVYNIEMFMYALKCKK